MLASRQIEAGKYYVNDSGQSARQVLKVDCESVRFCTYDLKTGKLCGAPNGECTKNEIIHWADREATLPEADWMDQKELDALFRRDNTTPGKGIASGSPRPDLLEQVRRINFMR